MKTALNFFQPLDLESINQGFFSNESNKCAFEYSLLDLLEDIFSNVYSKREAEELSDLQNHINSQLGTIAAEPVRKDWGN